MSEEKKDLPPPTDMLYMQYEGNWLTESEGTILYLDEATDSNTAERQVSVTLDRTVFHAQGGGQPTDTGKLLVEGKSSIDVSKVVLDRTTGVASHLGSFTQETERPIVGDKVKAIIDKDRRRILSECHTAGHVVDSAMARIGKSMVPKKAYHFLEGPYVEYTGEIPVDERPGVLESLKKAFQELVEENIDTEIALMSRTQADETCNRIAQNFDVDVFADPRTDQVRVVTVAGFPCPCGGTHVSSTGQLKENGWGVTKLRCKKGIVQVKYGQDTDK